MTISTYDTLKSGIADFLNRDDLTAVIPTFIDMAQGQINRDVRHWRMETTAQQDVVDDYTYLPDGWLEIKNAQYYPDINDYTKFFPLEYLSQNAFDERKVNSENKIGDPKYYTLAGLNGLGVMMLFPHPKDLSNNDKINVSYLKSFDLGVSNDNNWLLEDYPDVYLYGSLIHAAIYLKDDERLALFSQMYGAAVQRVNASSDEAEYKHDRLRTRKLGLDTSRSRQPNHVRWS
jgi:hypothetical protein